MAGGEGGELGWEGGGLEILLEGGWAGVDGRGKRRSVRVA